MNSLQTKFLEAPLAYDGTQLAPHWIYRNTDLLGDALVAFIGEAVVGVEHMVDLEDVKKNAPIYSPSMLHFIGEWFTESFELGIAYQHLFIHTVCEQLRARAVPIRREGDDIYVDNLKLSVSIATRSVGSVLMHTGLNIRTENTPVPTVGLETLGVPVAALADACLNQFSRDYTTWQRARFKVLPR
ncbi:MAG: DUF366 family protein [Bdellovibrionales bacterium]|nr:DUF366 family protein [Bdellovibrionales bacterium]